MDGYEIATRAEIQAIYERATELLDRTLEEDDEPFDRERQREISHIIGHVLEALRFCTVAARALGDPSLGGVVLDAISRMEDYDDHAERHRRTAHWALAALLQAGLPVDERVRAFAKGEDAGLREAVASGLRPQETSSKAILETLAADPVAAVRKAAQKALAEVGEVPWWSGKWKSDPAARLLPGEEEVCGPALRRISALLDLPQYTLLHDETQVADLCAALGKLPDELAVEAIEQCCRAAQQYAVGDLRPVLLLLFERRGGLDAFERLVDFWGRSDHGMMHEKRLAAIVSSAPRATRLAACQRLIARIVAAPLSQRTELQGSPAWLAAAIVAGAWPPGEDVTGLLDVVLALGEETPGEHKADFARLKLVEALLQEGVDPTPVIERLIEARVAGFPGAWDGIGHRVVPLLDRAHRDVLRRAAERGLATEDAATITWAARHLLGDLFDPTVDGAPLERVGAMLADPRLRAAIVAEDGLAERALPVLRAELRAGTLTYPEAVETMEAIGRLYGGLARSGVVQGPLRASRVDVATVEAERLERQAAMGVFLAPPELRGPPTEGEWEALRRARDAFRPDDEGERANLWSRTLSEGPWTGEERAYLEALFGICRAKPSGSLDFALASALAAKLDVELVPLFDEVVLRAEPDLRPLVKSWRTEARQVLGLQPSEKRKAAGVVPAEGDGGAWEDEEDEGGAGGEP